MSVDLRFSGKLTFEDEDMLAEALEQVEAAVAEEDEDLAELFEQEWDDFFTVTKKRVVVDIAFSGPSDWYLAVEGIVEGLTTDAVEGHIDGVMEGQPGRTRYFAGGEQDELDT